MTHDEMRSRLTALATEAEAIASEAHTAAMRAHEAGISLAAQNAGIIAGRVQSLLELRNVAGQLARDNDAGLHALLRAAERMHARIVALAPEFLRASV